MSKADYNRIFGEDNDIEKAMKKYQQRLLKEQDERSDKVQSLVKLVQKLKSSKEKISKNQIQKLVEAI